ncbi:hypothetical protein BDV96DRAFT_644704 [Lophiotrema nucula]|uniref:Uncharacterized protein n=1 Tax=Lophiotrema nucula TaxID=690887 RepID=A0A6A5ZFU1_9PLEO|nr:hypothetical protein BDV96DRAFT_644704 [Lophiotrema nucula]
METSTGDPLATEARSDEKRNNNEADIDIGGSPLKKPRLDDGDVSKKADDAAYFANSFTSTVNKLASAALSNSESRPTTSRIRVPEPGEISLDSIMAVHQAALGRPHPAKGREAEKIVETYQNTFRYPGVQANVLRSVAAQLPEPVVQEVNQGITDAAGHHLLGSVLPMLSRSNVPPEMVKSMLYKSFEMVYNQSLGTAPPSTSNTVQDRVDDAVAKAKNAAASRVHTSGAASSAPRIAQKSPREHSKATPMPASRGRAAQPAPTHAQAPPASISSSTCGTADPPIAAPSAPATAFAFGPPGPLNLASPTQTQALPFGPAGPIDTAHTAPTSTLPLGPAGALDVTSSAPARALAPVQNAPNPPALTQALPFDPSGTLDLASFAPARAIAAFQHEPTPPLSPYRMSPAPPLGLARITPAPPLGPARIAPGRPLHPSWGALAPTPAPDLVPAHGLEPAQGFDPANAFVPTHDFAQAHTFDPAHGFNPFYGFPPSHGFPLAHGLAPAPAGLGSASYFDPTPFAPATASTLVLAPAPAFSFPAPTPRPLRPPRTSNSPAGWFNFPEESQWPEQYRAMRRVGRQPIKLIKLKFRRRNYYLLGPAAQDMSQDPMLQTRAKQIDAGHAQLRQAQSGAVPEIFALQVPVWDDSAPGSVAENSDAHGDFEMGGFES